MDITQPKTYGNNLVGWLKQWVCRLSSEFNSMTLVWFRARLHMEWEINTSEIIGRELFSAHVDSDWPEVTSENQPPFPPVMATTCTAHLKSYKLHM